MWLSDPRVVEPVKLKAAPDGSAQLAVIAKKPGTTLLVVMRPGGGGHGYRVSVDASGIRMQSQAIGEYVAEL